MKIRSGKALKMASCCFAIGAILLIVLSPRPVVAHTPQSMTLGYNWDTQTLSVTISHTVTDPNSHYIQNMTIYKNDVKVDSRLYTSQESTTSASDNFNIAAVDGDVIRVWAECSQVGTIEDTVTVIEPSTTTPTTTDGTTTPPPLGFETTTIILAAVIVLGVILLAISVLRRR
ncbi:MAG: hypothetical protein ACFFEA_02360 [Candidatus Thorarchaeota archaeon]